MIDICRRSSAAVAFALLAGCADLRWQKEGVDPAAMQRDLDLCLDEARSKAQREAPLFGLPQPNPIGVDHAGRVIMGHSNQYDTERAILEHDFTRACMQGKGYKLGPAEKSAPGAGGESRQKDES